MSKLSPQQLLADVREWLNAVGIEDFDIRAFEYGLYRDQRRAKSTIKKALVKFDISRRQLFQTLESVAAEIYGSSKHSGDNR